MAVPVGKGHFAYIQFSPEYFLQTYISSIIYTLKKNVLDINVVWLKRAKQIKSIDYLI